MKPLDPSEINITSRPLHQPPLDELISVLAKGLTTNFAETAVELVDCPNFAGWPYNFYREGLCGTPIILDVGGPAYLLPTVQKDRFYDVKTILKHLNYNHDTLVIGAGAGPWPHTHSNCELIMKLNVVNNSVSKGSTYGMGVANGTHYAFVNQTNGKCILERLPANEDETTFALLANLYICEGKPGKVIKVHAKKRTGKLDFISCMQKALENQYKDKLVGLGGTFVMNNGKVKQHIMPPFSATPLNTEAKLNEWLRFYDMKTPLIAVGTFVSAETEKTAAESYRILRETYGDIVPSLSACEYWFRRFKGGDFNINDKNRSGQPKKLENTDLQALLDENPAQSSSELARALNVNRTTVSRRLHDMGKIRKEGKWVPYQLSENINWKQKKILSLRT